MVEDCLSRGSVFKDVSKVCPAFVAMHYNTDHAMTGIACFSDNIFIAGFIKTWPASTGIEFRLRTEQRLAADDIYIDAGFMVVPIFVVKGRFGGVLKGNLVLKRCQLFSDLFITRF